MRSPVHSGFLGIELYQVDEEENSEPIFVNPTSRLQVSKGDVTFTERTYSEDRVRVIRGIMLTYMVR